MGGFFPGPGTFPGSLLFPGWGSLVGPGERIPARIELDLDGDGMFATDITRLVRSSQQIQINRGRAEESSSPEPSVCTLTVDNRAGNFSSRNPVGAYYGRLGRNTPLRVAIDESASWLKIDTPTGLSPAETCYVSTPDTGALDITGDIDLRFYADLNSWRESMALVTKWLSAGNQRSYGLYLRFDGVIILYHTTGGLAAPLLGGVSAPLPITQGRLAVRGVADMNNGAGNRSYTFYTGPSLAGPWTQLGDPDVRPGTSSIFSGSGPLAVLDDPGASDLGASVITGKVFGAQVYNGIGGTLVANPDFTTQLDGSTSFTDTVGRVWTTHGAARLSTKNIRYIGEVPAWPTRWNLRESDIYDPLQASGVMRRLSQGQAALKSVLYRAITSLAHPAVAYWPCEDASGATVVASGLPDALPMHFIAAPGFGGDDIFDASAPIIDLGESSIYGYVPTYGPSGSHQVRFLMHVSATGSTDGAVICRIDCAGTATRWELVYGTGGSVTINVYDNASPPNLLHSQGPVGFNFNGFPLRVSIQLQQSGGNVNYDIRTARLNVALGGIAGTVTSRTVTRVTKVTMAPTKNLSETSVGHILVQDVITSNSEFLSEMQAYDGETAGRRIQRLCREEEVLFEFFGDLADTVAMGPQRPAQLLELLKECEAADMGMLGESRAYLGLAYRCRESLQNQVAAATLDYDQLADLEPVEDDSDVRNDVTVNRTKGSSARKTLAAGTLSVLAPPSGVGRYDTSITVSVQTDGQLPHQAGWRLNLGTFDEPRYPSIDVNLFHPTISSSADMLTSLRALDVGDRLVVTDPPVDRVGPGDISQLVQGVTEVIGVKNHTLTLKCSPERPWRVGTYGDAVDPDGSKYMSDGSTLGTARTSTQTSWSIVTPVGPLWTVNPAEYPFDFMVAGERVTVTAMSGTSSPQTATVTRSVNGIVKAQLSGAVVELYRPARYAL